MATCIPALENATSDSAAELTLLAALGEQLPQDFTVLHSVAWISKPTRSGPRDGEADLIIVHPRRGVLVVEVKGGRVSLDYRTQDWISIDRDDRVHEIKNPFKQGTKAKHALLHKLKENPAWQKLRIGRFNIGHAAFFPDVGDAHKLRGPDAPIELIGDRADMSSLTAWVEQAFSYWGSAEEDDFHEIGKPGVDVLVQLFARVATTRPLISARIKDEEERRIELTGRQAVILNYLQRQRRVMIAGGAGTGKTLIAREKAVRLAREGMKTLLVCFNRGLADHLREQSADVENLDVASFHQVCDRWIERAFKKTGRDLLAEVRREFPRADGFSHHMPIALANAIDLLGPKYDAIVVDEGQDFGDEFWLPVEMLLNDLEQSLLYVFLDENQDVFHRSAKIPIEGEPMLLNQNCRNTTAIHSAAYRYYRGTPMESPEIPGTEIELLPANDIKSQAVVIGRVLTRLISEEKVEPHDIAVLLCEGSAKVEFEKALSSFPKPSNCTLGRLEDYKTGVVVVDTVARFKGLERAVVILWAMDHCSPSEDRATLYVGMSRAKSLLYLCGTRAACERTIAATGI